MKPKKTFPVTLVVKSIERGKPSKVETPCDDCKIEAVFINAKPEGYALRILEYYRAKCDEKWEVLEMSNEGKVVYDLMNQHQDERAVELDKAISKLKASSQD